MATSASTSTGQGVEGPSIAVATSVGFTAACAMLLAMHGFDEAGARVCIRATARISALLLMVVLPASALHRRFRSSATKWILRNRRYLGLSLAASHTLHLGFILALYQMGILGEVSALTLYGGGWGYVLMYAMVATSNDASFRALGPNWGRLHTTGIYTLWVIFAVSYLPASDKGALGAALFAGLMLSMALRWWPAPKRAIAHS